jgi:predicted amidohydrolase YtcJ
MGHALTHGFQVATHAIGDRGNRLILDLCVDGGRIIGYDNAHGYHHRHCLGKVESIEFESYESIERRFEAEVRKYLESGEV